VGCLASSFRFVVAIKYLQRIPDSLVGKFGEKIKPIGEVTVHAYTWIWEYGTAAKISGNTLFKK